MSIRYVWGRYNITTTTSTGLVSAGKKDEVVTSQSAYFASGYSIDSDDTIRLSGVDGPHSQSTSTKKYAALGSNWYRLKTCFYYEPNDGSHWDFDATSTLYRMSSSGLRLQFDQMRIGDIENQSQGSKIGDISTPTSGQYPSNGVSGSYWYVYQGRDSIDPVSIEAPIANWLYIGQQVVVTASPSVSKVYGGTVSYQYQVQINGGSWTNIGNKTTATSVNYTIPEGTVSIAFRVQASDNMGFTSADWIQSETYAVSKYVPGIAQKLHRKNANGEYDLVHMETDTQIVLMNSGSTLEDELLAILAEIERRGG